MPEISAFRGIRYDLGHVGALEGVVAPARETIDDQLLAELYKQHPANVIRLIANRDEPGDAAHEKYSRAGRYFRNWQREGVLVRDPDPGIYVYHQEFEVAGKPVVRHGFLCRVKFDVDSFSPDGFDEEGVVEDRFRLISAAEACLDPVIGIYQDSNGEAQELLEKAIINVAPLQVEASSATHRIWTITDIHLVNELTSAMRALPVSIASGHPSLIATHRYAASKGESFFYALMMCVNLYDDGLSFLPNEVVDSLSAAMLDCDGDVAIPPASLSITPLPLSGLVFASFDQ